MAKLAKKVEYKERFVYILGPKGAFDLDLVDLSRLSAPCAQEQCRLVGKATGVGLWEVMEYWAEGQRRRLEKFKMPPELSC